MGHSVCLVATASRLFLKLLWRWSAHPVMIWLWGLQSPSLAWLPSSPQVIALNAFSIPSLSPYGKATQLLLTAHIWHDWYRNICLKAICWAHVSWEFFPVQLQALDEKNVSICLLQIFYDSIDHLGLILLASKFCSLNFVLLNSVSSLICLGIGGLFI